MHWDPARGSGHGSHYDYDTHVPLIFWGAAFKSAESAEETTPYDLAPTLAQLLGLELPDAVGRSRLPTSPSRPTREGHGKP
jgi:arylsulfatase A-like enzyme